MHKYLVISRLAVLDILEYKFDFLLNSLKYSMMVMLMTIIWLAVEKEGQLGFFSREQTVQYFIFATLIYTFSNFHTWFIEEDIRLGTLSKYLLKPISATGYYLFFLAARVLLDFVIKALVFVLILPISGFALTTSPMNILGFLTFLPFVFLFSFAFLGSVSLLTFWVTEAYAVRWAVTILSRFLSGILVPLIYFPDILRPILLYLPFQHLAFTPIQIVSQQLTFLQGFHSWLILLSWTVVMWACYSWLFRKGVRTFEGIGI